MKPEYIITAVLIAIIAALNMTPYAFDVSKYIVAVAVFHILSGVLVVGILKAAYAIYTFKKDK